MKKQLAVIVAFLFICNGVEKNSLESSANFKSKTGALKPLVYSKYLHIPFADYVCNITSVYEANVVHMYIIKNSANPYISQKIIECVTSFTRTYNENKSTISTIFIRNIESFDQKRKFLFPSLHILMARHLTLSEVRRVTTFIEDKIPKKKYLKYVFVFLRLTDEDKDQVLIELFEIMWFRKQILNAIAIFPNSLTNKLNIFTFEPFTQNEFRLKNITEMPLTNLFYDKLRNLNQNHFKISIFHDPIRFYPINGGTEYKGIDRHLADIIMKHINAKPIFLEARDNQIYGALMNNKRLSGVLKDIADNYTNVGLNSRITILDGVKAEFLEATYPYTKLRLCFLVPAAKILPQYLTLFQTLDEYTWMTLVLTYIIVVLLLISMKNFVFKITGIREYQNIEIFQVVLKALVGDAIIRLPKIDSIRIVLQVWIMFSYIITNVFFAKLETIFVFPEYEEELNRISDLTDFHGSIFSPIGTRPFVQSSMECDPSLWSLVDSKLKDTLVFAEPITGYPLNTIFLLRTDQGKKYVSETFNKLTFRPNYHIMEECPTVVPQGYLVTLGSPYLEKIDSMLSLIFESGLMKHREKLFNFIAKIVAVKKDQDASELIANEAEDDLNENDAEIEEDTPRKIVLTLEILQSAFHIWWLGIGISSVIFICELIIFNYDNLQSNPRISKPDSEFSFGEVVIDLT